MLLRFIRTIGAGMLIAALTVSVAQAEGPSIGSPAPDFTLNDTNGKAVKLSDFKGKVVVLEWTNPNCPFVQRHYKNGNLPGLQKAALDKGIVWLAVNSTNAKHKDFETPADLNKTFGDWKAAYTAQLLDTDGKVGKLYDARTTPHMFVIDARGILVYQGAIDDDPRGNKEQVVNYVRSTLDLIEAGKPVSTSTTTPYGCSVKYE